jgi:branched-subunit amino acid transport protein
VSVWITILAAAAGTYALRVSMLVLVARRALPEIVERATRCGIPPIFAALAAASLARHAALDPSAAAPFAAVAAGAAAVRRTGSPTAALLAGMPTLWLLSALLGA